MAKKKTDSERDGGRPLRDSLAKELRSLIPKLDSEGLAFLLEQARIHLYNMQVVELNRAAQAARAAALRKGALAKKGPSGTRGAAKTRPVSKKTDDTLRIEGTASGSSYYLYFRNKSLMFSKGEMTHLVKMVKAPGTDLEIRERLYNWFDRERKDIFAVLPLADKFDDLLKVLVRLIKKSFTLRK